MAGQRKVRQLPRKSANKHFSASKLNTNQHQPFSNWLHSILIASLTAMASAPLYRFLRLIPTNVLMQTEAIHAFQLELKHISKKRNVKEIEWGKCSYLELRCSAVSFSKSFRNMVWYFWFISMEQWTLQKKLHQRGMQKKKRKLIEHCSGNLPLELFISKAVWEGNAPGMKEHSETTKLKPSCKEKNVKSKHMHRSG